MVGFAACIWVAMHNKRTQIMVALHPRGALAITDHFGPGCREKNYNLNHKELRLSKGMWLSSVLTS